KQELTRHGIAGDVADRAIADVVEDESIDESMSIDLVARKKLRLLGAAEPAVKRRRLYAFLARRGFNADDIQGAIRRLRIEESEADSATD
ncbi:MAG TPA: RecX family transcriptional regulator, partial [Gemmatimonadaceae bacterium]|nr:RecX family transcriptional regulator [Gemmatimonadaceae bacterium]